MIRGGDREIQLVVEMQEVGMKMKRIKRKKKKKMMMMMMMMMTNGPDAR